MGDFSYAANEKYSRINTLVQHSDTWSSISKEEYGTGKIEPNESMNTTKDVINSGSEENREMERSIEEEKVKKDINTYIIDSYKAQGTKILKDLDSKLQKTLPEPSERKEAYKKIRTALDLRKKRIENTKTSETKKMILEEFLDHMMDNLDKKIEDLNT